MDENIKERDGPGLSVGCMLVNIMRKRKGGEGNVIRCRKDGEDYQSEDVQDEGEQNGVGLCEEKEEGEGKEEGKYEDEKNKGDGDEGEGASVGKGGGGKIVPPGMWDIEDPEARSLWIGIPKQDNFLPSSTFHGEAPVVVKRRKGANCANERSHQRDEFGKFLNEMSWEEIKKTASNFHPRII